MLEISAPITDGKLTGKGRLPNGWRVKSSSGAYTAYAICTGGGESAENEKEQAESAEESAAGAKAG